MSKTSEDSKRNTGHHVRAGSAQYREGTQYPQPLVFIKGGTHHDKQTDRKQNQKAAGD